jgi:hypothetical protein
VPSIIHKKIDEVFLDCRDLRKRHSFLDEMIAIPHVLVADEAEEKVADATA